MWKHLEFTPQFLSDSVSVSRRIANMTQDEFILGSAEPGLLDVSDFHDLSLEDFGGVVFARLESDMQDAHLWVPFLADEMGIEYRLVIPRDCSAFMGVAAFKHDRILGVIGRGVFSLSRSDSEDLARHVAQNLILLETLRNGYPPSFQMDHPEYSPIQHECAIKAYRLLKSGAFPVAERRLQES